VDYFWLGTLNSLAPDADYQAWTNALNNAQAQGQAQMFTQARALGRYLFQSASYLNLNRTDEEFITDLYFGYLQRGPDPGGFAFWLNILHSDNAQGLNGRENLLQAFELSQEFIDEVNSLQAMPPEEDP
jgi:hypothetical protein